MTNEDHADQFNTPGPSRPPRGINLFSASSDRNADAIIGNRGIRWGLYCGGYKQAADALVDHFFKEHDYSAYHDAQAYPIIFLYRHYLELRLKELFISYGYLSGDSAEVRGHRLITLWRKVCERAKRVSTESTYEIDADMEALEDIIKQFDSIDQNSDVFRYPVLSDGKTQALPPIQIGLQQLKEVMHWASDVLDGWNDGVYQYIDDSHEANL